ncbi:hypothetical protein QBC38DRAFT_538529 [Podospora fimiseda]|uniref:Heterokaryon incompatibility domain-containing protein n=1 Tax=Podospora fimiseda TaxID=252190 RepID=A0AAN7BJA6_9PEZI|nr:hypothetical protein QBC38DRAFT_538529 [Podospora fimiseda]
MRLLYTDRIHLIEVYGSNIPRYAILSHTWGDEEVLLQDLLRIDPNTSWALEWVNSISELGTSIFGKNGFYKLYNSVKLARNSGYDFIWIDTCCIHKTTSDVCYVYLEDVMPAGKEDVMQNSTFRLSRWFTHGWTLQELIAPKKVSFFAGDWSYLGDKSASSAFTNLLHEITRIQRGVLTGETARPTTHVEDIAYCLLGIFDVNMPLLYGEGNKAFIRLQEAILLKDDGQTLFAWYDDDNSAGSHSTSRLSGLLADCPRRFWGVDELEAAIPISSTSNPVAVTKGSW